MKSPIVLFVLYTFFVATISATPVDLFASPKKSLDGWYHARASFMNTNNDNAHLIKKRSSSVPSVTVDDSSNYNDTTTTDGVSRRSVNAEITFYTGQDLKNSACYDRNGLPAYNAKDTDFIAAMSMKDFEFCYQCLRVERKHRHVIVKVIDKCGGCPEGGKNVDLTKSAFSKLATFDEGRVNIRWRPIPCPKKGSWPTFELK